MDAPPPDPYKALGLTKDAEATTIKTTYRKLVLKCHPDKVEGKQDEFHKIQQAYELIGDEESRRKYDLEEQLLALKRERARNGPSVNAKPERYDLRTAAPAGSRNYEERKTSTSRSFEDDRQYEERTRKFDTYDPFPKDSRSRTSRTDKEIPIRMTRPSADRTRSDQKKTRDRDERRDRSGKFPHIEEEFSSNDEKARYETEYRRRSDDVVRKMKEAEEAKRVAAEARQKAEDRRSFDDPRYDRQRKTSDQESEAMRHMQRHKTEVPDLRPAASRTTSSRDVRPETYDRARREIRPEPVRRSSARPKETHTSSSGRDRDRKAMPEIVDWGVEDRSERKMPSFQHSSSSPAELHVPARTQPQRSYTEAPPREHRRRDTSPIPVFHRSETMPVSHSSSRWNEATQVRPSHLRSSETLSHQPRTHSPENAYPTIPPPQPTKKYYYPPATGVHLSPDIIANGHHVIAHEPIPSRHRARSPSPLSRPPMGPNRPSETTSQYQASGPKLSGQLPPILGRSATMNTSSPRVEERGRARPTFYAENPKRETRRTSYSPESVSYSKKLLPDDIRWSNSRQPVSEKDFVKPTFSRHATTAH